MDLEKYKKAWDNQEDETNKVSTLDIYKMAQSRSTSIVKWIFIIGILEFIVFNCMFLFVDLNEAREAYNKIGVGDFVFYGQIISWIILLYFLVKFYLNYKNISIVKNTKTLMTDIVKTRRTVRNYVIFNLSSIVFVSIVVSTATLLNGKELPDGIENPTLFIVAMIVFTLILVGVFWLFYQLIYGILLKKLNKNYKEIAKLDELN